MKTTELFDSLSQKALDSMKSAWALKEDCEKLKAELNLAQQENEVNRGKINDLNNSLSQLQISIGQQDEKIQVQNKEIQFLTRQKDNTLMELQQKQAEWKDVSGQLTEKINELGACRTKISELQADNERLQSELKTALKGGKHLKAKRPGKNPAKEA